MIGSVRVTAGMLLCGYVLAVAGILLATEPTLAVHVIARAEAWLAAHGAPAWVTWPGRVELVLNAAMFAPVTFLASLAVPRHPWGNWVAYAFLASGFVEVVQAFVLEPRSAQYVDVVANTLGGLMGAAAAIPVCHRMRGVSVERSG